MKNDDDIEWIEFDPENDPRIKKVPPPRKYEGDGCGWLLAIGFILFIFLFILCAGLVTSQ